MKHLPEINIGMLGHVDHGKTTLTEAITGKWTDEHSEELKRGITIRLGYADAEFYYCEKCDRYTNNPKCDKCFEDCKFTRAVSFVDAPGHETLMATVLSATSLMDGAILLISADEPCPQPQTAEHLKALEISNIEKIVIVQNKIDLVSKDEAFEHYEQIKTFIQNTIAENSPIIPVSAVHRANVDEVIRAVEEYIKTPKRNENANPKFLIARSFDVNKPGTDIKKLHGGVIGGSVIKGVFKENDEIEIKPGSFIEKKYTPLETTISNIIQNNEKIKIAKPGGLLAMETTLDPSISKNDGLAGSIVGLKNELPDILYEITIKPKLFDYVIGVAQKIRVEHLKQGDILMLTINITKTIGIVKEVKKGYVSLNLKIPVCAEKGERISISKQITGRWHLIGYGEII